MNLDKIILKPVFQLGDNQTPLNQPINPIVFLVEFNMAVEMETELSENDRAIMDSTTCINLN